MRKKYVNKEVLDGLFVAFFLERSALRFGQFFINQTGYIVGGSKEQTDFLWEEKDPDKAYRIIYDDMLLTQCAG